MPRSIVKKLSRKNLIVDGYKVKQLKKMLGAVSESAAVRIAIDRALHIQEALAALRSLRKRGTVQDVYYRARS